ncbi:MAG TPA: type IVB secretion system protein IcmV [Gammaproteobacteria bacterium]|nr:type IVB secretion system protein IcmV [Gammaproteobacteria bacterium]
MPAKDVLKVSRKTFFNPRAWFGYDFVADQTRTMWSIFKGATALPQPVHGPETFEEAMRRLNVNEADLVAISKSYFNYAILFVTLTAIDLTYGIYLLFHHRAFLGLVLALAVSALLLAQAFKYHFWYFQIKNRKLGCTVEEWRQGKVNPNPDQPNRES